MSVMTPRASRNAGFLRSTLTCLLLEPGDPSSRSGYDSGSGNGNDEAPAFLPVLVQIPHDLLREIPRQEERVVRLRPQQLRVGPHRDVRARREAADLELRLLRHEVEDLRADPAVIEQGHALRWRAHPRDGLAIGPEAMQPPEQVLAIQPCRARQRLERFPRVRPGV